MYDTNLQRLLDAFPTIKSVKVHRAALWILGEYAATPDDIQAVMNQVRQTLGEVVINIFDNERILSYFSYQL
jgi:coatomer subunit beta